MIEIKMDRKVHKSVEMGSELESECSSSSSSELHHQRQGSDNSFDNSSSSEDSKSAQIPPKTRLNPRSLGVNSTNLNHLPNTSVQHLTVHPFHLSSVIRPPPNVTLTTSSKESPSLINNTKKSINQR